MKGRCQRGLQTHWEMPSPSCFPPETLLACCAPKMPSYTFESLSGREFEHLVRDLLQAEHARTYESFSPGKDGGIDIRWVNRQAGELTLVQCKQYAGSGFNAL